MCDAFIPRDALSAEAERTMLGEISELLIDHELRRMTDLVDDPGQVRARKNRARRIAWLYVHRPELYVASEPAQAPHYRFVCNVPEGQADDEFRVSVTRDITAAVERAEGGRWPYLMARVWVIIGEVPDGSWGGFGQVLRLRDIVGYVAPDIGAAYADERLAERRLEQAKAIAAVASA
jgi:phenylpyruvate tautomerase PptA (4-oxalocrotonate tautomerase family)